MENNFKFNKLIPELSVSNIEKSLDFYINILGFKLEYERKTDKFAFLSFNGSQIMIEQINNHWAVGDLEKPFGRGINFQIECSNVEEISTKLKNADYPIFKDVFESKYKADGVIYTEKELLVQDLDGYLIRFQQTIAENNFVYRKATLNDLEKIWDKDILANAGEEAYVRWKKQYIDYNLTGKAATFVVLDKEEPIGQITLLMSPECSAVKDKPLLCDEKTGNMNAFRIEKQYEGQGHISKLVRMAEEYAKSLGLKYLTIGSEAKETRNMAIYLHFGYNKYIMNEVYEGDLVLYFKKEI